jgi:hypothetical protein
MCAKSRLAGAAGLQGAMPGKPTGAGRHAGVQDHDGAISFV